MIQSTANLVLLLVQLVLAILAFAKWMVYFTGNPMKMDENWGDPILGNLQLCVHYVLQHCSIKVCYINLLIWKPTLISLDSRCIQFSLLGVVLKRKVSVVQSSHLGCWSHETFH